MMQQVPPWLEPLLTTRFFSTCGAHAGRPRSECNKFCLDCRAPAFCYYCRQQRHAAHRVIQVRRSSYHDVVRVADVEEALDVAGVQTYVINGARVLFLNQRPQPPPRGSGTLARGTTYSCRVCARALLDTFRFCSLGCKLASIKRSGAGAEEGAGSGDVVDSDSNGRQQQQHLAPTMAPAVRKHRRRHRRKGIPRRAPLGS
ncbi:uncharacterized protein LOC100828424 isoform X2 [Brachypodium distachyon]|uniref:B box-type domain-containing protein n=1 Tax=Brachypodium distachyon TaxID=15368 RepID=A0A2K2CT50_BRADI|nr:uncharacterized protein LOC100828424 isoform X2 [Brachypodium distachyon]PNT65210.1 hypothetical protein BRADI_4g38790v3 [Brachypodium distachyon]|eukprot:XP_024318706.1 uncharacterized protein LOC100828424 isoform X2 [Brachypodium distachyon]